MGTACRYDGQSKPMARLDELAERYTLIPVCPEQLGSLPTPRTPAERQGQQVVTQDGRDVTEAYRHGAEEALKLAQLCGCTGALLKERSPSCGSSCIYDGSFSRRLIPGLGVTAQLLQAHGISLWGESQLEELL